MMVAALTTAGLATAVVASPVYTPTSPDSQAESVSLTGLDLHSERGAKLALSRIRQAAKDVCGVPVDVGPIWASARPNTCVITVVDRAVAKLDDPMVSALNSGHGRLRRPTRRRTAIGRRDRRPMRRRAVGRVGRQIAGDRHFASVAVYRGPLLRELGAATARMGASEQHLGRRTVSRRWPQRRADQSGRPASRPAGRADRQTGASPDRPRRRPRTDHRAAGDAGAGGPAPGRRPDPDARRPAGLVLAWCRGRRGRHHPGDRQLATSERGRRRGCVQAGDHYQGRLPADRRDLRRAPARRPARVAERRAAAGGAGVRQSLRRRRDGLLLRRRLGGDPADRGARRRA